ncbi:MAG: hypothetical protein MJ230_01670 [bacterium]|nr:hypothetical protein [bacterium]
MEKNIYYVVEGSVKACKKLMSVCDLCGEELSDIEAYGKELCEDCYYRMLYGDEEQKNP